jgi:MinD-like ATPase involved in chromosome partitioning or flagellar assembly
VSDGARVIVVAGAGGGAGASILAAGLALACDGAWLIDLDHDRGDLAAGWDLVGERTTADLLPVADELTPVHLRHAARRHPSGTTVLAAPGRPGAGAAWRPRTTGALVATAREAAGPGGAVVLDAGTGVPPEGAAGDLLLLVCAPSLCGARRASAALAVLRQRRDDRRCALVVGGRPGRPEVGARALGRLVGAPVAGELPWSPREAQALGAGRLPDGRRARLARTAGDLAGWAP